MIGVALVMNGAIDIIKAFARHNDEPVADIIGGAASVIFGSLALTWPDLTIFAVAVLFGARTVLLGLTQLISGIQRWRYSGQGSPTPAASSPDRARVGRRKEVRVGALFAALALLALSVTIRSETDEVSAFYGTPDDLPNTPGVLLRTEPLDGDLPENTEGWLILFSTSTSLGEPAAGSAFVLASSDRTSDP